MLQVHYRVSDLLKTLGWFDSHPLFHQCPASQDRTPVGLNKT